MTGQRLMVAAACTALLLALSVAAVGPGAVGATGASRFECFGKEATYVGTPGNDRLRFDTDNGVGGMVLVLRGGRDRVSSYDLPNMRICAGGGRDRVEVSDNGGEGARIEGGGGQDRISNAVDADSSITRGMVVLGGTGNDRISTTGFPDRIEGGPGNDSLFGGSDDDRIIGGRGDDSIIGWGDDDKMFGGPGDDFLDGDPSPQFDLYQGKDLADGGRGRDECQGEIKRSCEL